MSDGNGWTQWREYVLRSLDELKANNKSAEKRMRNIELRIAMIVAVLLSAREFVIRYLLSGGP